MPLALAACSSTNSANNASLRDIVMAERGINAPTDKCQVPADVIGKPHTVLKDKTFKVPVRVLYPDSPATMDFNPNRLNFKTDKKGIVREITCG